MLALAGALSIGLMGASGDSVSPGDSQFTHRSMTLMLQSIADAEAVHPNASGSVKTLAADVQRDELAMGSQLASIASYYNISVGTDLPKSQAEASSFAAAQSKSLAQLIALFKDESLNGGGAQLRSFATEALPILEKDLAAARAAR